MTEETEIRGLREQIMGMSRQFSVDELQSDGSSQWKIPFQNLPSRAGDHHLPYELAVSLRQHLMLWLQGKYRGPM